MHNDIKTYFSLLYAKYNKLVLTKQELCTELDISLRTLNSRMAQNMDIPSYIKGEGVNSKVMFPLDSVATYLVDSRTLINSYGGSYE